MSRLVLLTGGLGYLGGRLARALVKDGYRVRCGTRRLRPTPPEWLPNMQMVTLNWMSTEVLSEACRGVDCIVHLAAMDEYMSSIDPVGALEANGLASLRLLEAAKLVGVSRFIYFSTAHVYGAPLQGNIDETTLPRPIHPYAITHRVSEDFVLAAHDRKQIEGVVVRLSNSFGSPVTAAIDRWTLLVNDLCRQAATTRELRLKSNGTQLRDFITLKDVARAVDHLLRLDTEKLTDGLFNLGGSKTMSILEMTERVAARWKLLSGKDATIVRQVDNATQPARLNYSCYKLSATGFTLTGEIDREIDDTLKLCLKAFGNKKSG